MMKKKIVKPTDEEMAEYGGAMPGAGGNESSVPASEPSGSASADQAATSGGNEANDWKDKFLRAKAELLNYQRRAEKDRADALKYANASLAKSLLPVLDNLERVLESGRDHKDNVDAILDGIKLIIENFHKSLREFHVEMIDAHGQPFDPMIHEAVLEQPSEEHSERTVLQEVQRGYRLHERVLRPSKVIVSKPKPRAMEGNQEESLE